MNSLTNSKNSKHAYLIMAHHRPDLLQALIDALDDEHNDLFVHIDKHADPKMSSSGFLAHHARLYFIERMAVNWGGYSQIACTMKLLEAALAVGQHCYYHLLTGVTYPLKSQTEIQSFFAEHEGHEFVGFASNDYEWRVSLMHFFNEWVRSPVCTVRISDELPAVKITSHNRPKFIALLDKVSLKIQKILGVNRFARFNMSCKKGFAYWHITQPFAEYLCEHKSLIHDMMHFSWCGDEIFVQTLLANSPFASNVYRDSLGETCSMVASTWELETTEERPGHNFLLKDLDYLLSRDDLFALKFEGEDGPALIEAIKKHIYAQ